MTPMVPGLRYLSNFLDAEAHDRLLQAADSQPWCHAGGGRSVQIYGYSYHHAKGGIYRLGDLPPWTTEIAERLCRDGLMPWVPDQMIANEYGAGTGIFAHLDLDAFDHTIVSISLGSACVMQFIESDAGTVETILLEPGSALVLSGDARYKWKHAIAPQPSDFWMGREIVRGRRVSLTFRRMLPSSAK